LAGVAARQDDLAGPGSGDAEGLDRFDGAFDEGLQRRGPQLGPGRFYRLDTAAEQNALVNRAREERDLAVEGAGRLPAQRTTGAANPVDYPPPLDRDGRCERTAQLEQHERRLRDRFAE